MHRVLLGAVAVVATRTAASPASAQGAAAASGFSGVSASRSFGGLRAIPGGRDRGDFRHRGGHFRHIHVADAFPAGWGYGGYDDFDINQSWEPDSFNDWWHDRPDRAYPRWMSRNRDCARQWYSGDTLTC
jgi:hypothetical protein